MASTQIEQLRFIHSQILSLAILGWSKPRIAKEVGLSPHAVGEIMESALFKRERAKKEFELSAAIAPVQEYLTTHALELVDRELGLAFQKEDKRTAHAASASLLDRIGLVRTMGLQVQGAIVTANMSTEELRQILTRRLTDSDLPDEEQEHHEENRGAFQAGTGQSTNIDPGPSKTDGAEA